MSNFSLDYEVCNCKKVTIADIQNCIKEQNATTLNQIQELTGAGTECRHCIFPEGDFGKVKKKIYYKNILEDLKVANG